MTRFRLALACFAILPCVFLLMSRPCSASVGPDGRPLQAAMTGLKGSDFEAGTIPAFAVGFDLRREADNRLVLHGVLDGCHVWVQPQGSTMTNLRNVARPGDAAGALNYGLQMGALQAHAPNLETNDSGFGKLFGAPSTADRCDVPRSDPSVGSGEYTTPALILGGCFLLAVVAVKFKRSP